jgi:hypothetical protein
MNATFAVRKLDWFRGGLGLIVLFGMGCSATVYGPGGTPTGSGASGTGASGPGGSGTGAGGTGVSGTGGAGGPGSTGGVGPGGTGGRIITTPAAEGARLRLLTQAEFTASLTSLFGTLKGNLELLADTSVAGFVAVGASEITVSELGGEAYEAATRAATAEVFGDAMRSSKLVGCTPKADLSDECVATFFGKFGKQAFRRPVTAEEVTFWSTVARNAAKVTGSSAALGLSTAVSAMLQSPNFLYRVEATKPDATTGRLKFDGFTMASRLAYLLTGSTPSATLLDAAAAGSLDTIDGVRAAATPLLAATGASNRMAEFFTELADVGRILEVDKDPKQFAALDATLRSAMQEETRQFISNIVLAPGADVRSLFDSTRTYVNAPLAAFYGVPAPTGTGFAMTTLPATSGRAGILGQGSFLAVHATATSSAPARRGNFIVDRFLCKVLPPPPPGVALDIPIDPSKKLTTRQRFEQHRIDKSCETCHQFMDPYGFALEHFDPIGRYRTEEDGLPIDSTGMLNGKSFDGAAQLAALMREDPSVASCLMQNFYRHANGRPDDVVDNELVKQLATSLATKGYVWRDLVAEFVTSDAFRSAPATR